MILVEFGILIVFMDTIHDIVHSIINHLIPHEGNDYKPHLLQRGAMVMMLLLIMVSFLAANFQALLWQSSDWLVGAVLPAVVIDLTNTERATLDLPQLSRNVVLDQAAKLKAEDMARNSYFSHDSPTGITPWYWFKQAGYPFVHAGENLAVYFTDSTEVVDAWMNSPTHRANIVGTNYREIGVGTAKGTYDGFETVFVVQMFGTPAVAQPVVSVVSAPLPKATPAPLVAVAPEPLETYGESVDQGSPQVAGEMMDVPEETIVASTVDINNTKKEQEAVPVSLAMIDSTDEPRVVPVAQHERTFATVPPVPTPEYIPATNAPVDNREVVSLYSGMAASSTNLTPAPYTTANNVLNNAPIMAALATEPSTLLQLIYLILGSITALALIASVVLEWRHHRPVQTVYGLALLLVMAGLFYIHTIISTGAIVI